MNLRFLFSLSIIVFSSVVFAVEQEEVESTSSVKPAAKKSPASLSIGANIGSVVGNGLIVRSYFKRSFVQFTYAGYLDKIQDEKYFNASASYVRYLKKVKPSPYTSPVGLKWIIGGGAVYDKMRGKSANKIKAGSGFGIDFGAVGEPGFIFSLNAIYTLGFAGLRSPSFETLQFEPTVGALYNFK